MFVSSVAQQVTVRLVGTTDRTAAAWLNELVSFATITGGKPVEVDQIDADTFEFWDENGELFTIEGCDGLAHN